MAAADSVDVEFTGRDAHGSMPHLSVDPIVMASGEPTHPPARGLYGPVISAAIRSR